MPLGQDEYRRLFRSYPAFADYLPFAGHDPGERLFSLDDGVSVGAAYRFSPADLDASSEARRAEFNGKLDYALSLLPEEGDHFPYVLQLYLENRAPPDQAAALARQAAERARETPFTEAWLAAVREHQDIMRSPRGIFDDTRQGEGHRAKGWRAIDLRVYGFLYRKAPPAVWKRGRLAPAAQFNRAVAPFEAALAACGVEVRRLDEQGLCAWLTPWLTPHVAGFESPEAAVAAAPVPPPEARGAAWDLAQRVLQYPPLPIPERDPERDRGAWRFGPVYTRYLTLQGIEKTPPDGLLTLDVQDGEKILACPWDRMPPETILNWTVVPRAAAAVERHLDAMQAKVDKTRSDGARVAREQLEEARAALRQREKVYNVQMGAFLRAPDLETLQWVTQQATTVLAGGGLYAIPPQFDLIADDTFVRALPGVYSWAHDKGHALRSRMTYGSHLAAVLPFFGRSTGTCHPCFAGWHRRDGQVFDINFFHPQDRARVSHAVVFGPTGAGKSATAINMALCSMAVNRPRQIIIEKGNSFGLMCAYYARCGLDVREILFGRGQDVSFPPYFETRQALAEHRGELAPEGDEDEQRSYLAEMLHMTEIMVTGGRDRDVEALTTSDRAAMQAALIRALEASEAAGAAHARPADVAEALLRMAEREAIPEIRLRVRQMADALSLWTQGLRGHFFNRFGGGLDDAFDVLHVDLGLLTGGGNEDMLSLAVLAMLAKITALGERHQASGRPAEVWFDEAHYIAKKPLTARGFVVGTKVWRKLDCWLVFCTQDFSDTGDLARQILSQAEFWLLLSMGADEARKVAQFRDLGAEHQRLLTLAIKQPGRFVEAVLFSEKFPPALLRIVPPPLALALAQTEGSEKNHRLNLMRERGLSELDAALAVAGEIAARRRAYALEDA
ncbi:MAG: conjugative transfer ATPase [bacterium]|nr:conjugative transfer ATPase [bacterium]